MLLLKGIEKSKSTYLIKGESMNIKKLGIVALVSLLSFTSLPMNTNVMKKNNEQVSFTKPEDIYVDIIGESERTTNFNENWKFYRGNKQDAEKQGIDTQEWESITLPHDYSIDTEFTVAGEAESGFLLGGVGWYRKEFIVPEKYADKQLTIEFDGAYMNSEIYVNGKKIGTHPYGYTAFAYNLKDHLVIDGKTENVIAVKTDNKLPSSRWYSGSGIYRDVKLTVADEVHVANTGVVVTADAENIIANGNGELNVVTTVDNDSEDKQTVDVKTSLVDAKGKVVATSGKQNKSIEVNSTTEFNTTMDVENVTTWSIENPYLYTVRVEVSKADKTIDTYDTVYGFRHYNFDANTGFSLNGEKMKLKGVSMHHDQGSLGAVANRDAIARQVKILKEMGANAIRVTHNPAATVLLEICDEEGMLVINEAFDGWTEYKNGNTNDYTKYFNTLIEEDNEILHGSTGMKWGEFDAKAMVRSGINNPSIIMWSIGNEIDEGVSGNTSHYVELSRDIIRWIQETDATRPVTIGDNRRGDGNVGKIDQIIHEAGGVVGFNYANATAFKNKHSQNPEWKLYGAETTSAIHSRGIYSTYGTDGTNLQLSEYDNDQAKVGWGHSASNAWSYVIENDFNAGQFVWTGFDYLGEPTPWNGVGQGSVSGQGPTPNSSYFGIVDTAGFPKDTYYLYKSLWDEKNDTLHIMSNWNNDEIVKNGNGKVQVDVYSNAHTVELYLNDEKVGTQTATEYTTTTGYKYQKFGNKFYPSFEVTWAAGTLRAVALDKEGNVIEETVGNQSATTTVSAAKLVANSDKSEIIANGSSLSYITVDVQDGNGNFVAGANNKIDFSVEGNGKIVGVDNGNAASIESYKGSSRKAFSGKALVIVQSTKEEGSFTLKATSDGLESASVTVQTGKDTSSDGAYLSYYTMSKDVYVAEGTIPTLPSSVTGTNSDGSKVDLSITWNAVSEEDVSEIQVFDVEGTIDGKSIPVTMKIHVIGDIVAFENYATMTTAEVMPKLPQTLRGFYADGTFSEYFPVSWELSSDDYATKGMKNIVGSLSVLNEVYTANLSLRVLDKLADAKNIASKNFVGAPVFKNGTLRNGVVSDPSTTAINDSLLELNDGVKTESVRESARWTNWGLRNENPTVDTYVQLDWSEPHKMQNVKLWHFTDNAFSVVPGDDNVRFEYLDTKDNTWKEIESSHITQVSYLAGDTPYGFIHAIETQSLRVWLKSPTVGKCIGLTEIEVYESVNVPEANGSINIEEVTLNGTPIESFNGFESYDEQTKTYVVRLEDSNYPELDITSNNAATTILPIYEHVQRAYLVAEDRSADTMITVVYDVAEPAVDMSELNTLIETVEALDEAAYTPESWTALQEALETAKAVVSGDTPTQEAIDQAYASLDEAYKGLEQVAPESMEKQILKIFIDLAQVEVDNGNVDKLIDGAKAEYYAALEEAIDLYEDANATSEAMSLSIIRLTEALELLDYIKADTTKLQALYDECLAVNLDDYMNNEAKENFMAALENAKAVLSIEGGALTYEVEEAYEQLESTLVQLVLKPSKDALAYMISLAEAKDANADRYTKESYGALLEALAEAKEVYEDEDATAEQISTQVNKLAKVIAQLRLKVDRSYLSAKVEGIKATNFGAYTEASVARLMSVVSDAEAFLATPEQSADVEAAQLQALSEKLDEALATLEIKDEKPTEPETPEKPEVKPEPSEPTIPEQPGKSNETKVEKEEDKQGSQVLPSIDIDDDDTNGKDISMVTGGKNESQTDSQRASTGKDKDKVKESNTEQKAVFGAIMQNGQLSGVIYFMFGLLGSGFIIILIKRRKDEKDKA